MVIALCMDMEGISQITTPPEVFPWRAEYWRRGRELMTADAVAAIEGLLAGGASEVLVLDNHFADEQRNLIADRLPAGARIVDWRIFDLAHPDIDATLQVGRHARCGIADGFMSHTFTRNLRLRVDGELVSESHMLAWASGAPLLGIVGNAALGKSLGSLQAAAFLAVQESRDRASATPLYEPAAGREQIRLFSEQQMQRLDSCPRFGPPDGATVTASIATGSEAAPSMVAAGWSQVSETEFVVKPIEWAQLAQPIYAAIAAAVAPSGQQLTGLDLSTSAVAAEENKERVRPLDEVGMRWATEPQPEWIGALDDPAGAFQDCV